MKLDTPRRTVQLVAGRVDFEAALIDISNADVVGVDAERASGFRYSQRAYLLQVATSDCIWLLDPLGLDDSCPGWPEDLAEALAATVWILHAATQDLPNLAELAIYPSALYDTEVAARLIGLERFGLASICLELLDLDLAKEHSASDWSVRPLSKEMLNYAALDVDVLFELKTEIDARLEDLGRTEWAKQEFRHLVGFKPRQKFGDPWQHISGYSSLKKPEQQRIAAALWLARDEIARDLDSAPGRLIPDRSIIAAAKESPKSKADLAALKEFHGRASRSKLETWWQAIAGSNDIVISSERGSDIPNHRNWERRWPEAHARLDVARGVIIEIAAELGISQENLLSPDTLRRLCWEPLQTPVNMALENLGARAWQIELVSDRLSDALGQLLS